MLAALAALTLLASPTPAPKTCRAELGKKKAKALVAQCREVSPATHPPCNDANPCALITDEIKRGCGMLEAGKKPAYCSEYEAKAAPAEGGAKP